MGGPNKFFCKIKRGDEDVGLVPICAGADAIQAGEGVVGESVDMRCD